MSYQSTTRNITVHVDPAYMDEESAPEENYFFFSYHIRIENQGEEVVQLRARHWRITDAHGQAEEVHGVGVVGEEPKLKPGDAFEYTSGAPLATPSGIMAGSYTMETDKGEKFDVIIPAFSLDSPYEQGRIH
ncbi:MAG: Co2+/Mg2+ efflux protein ApaG [Alphaproteobacteria bacterium]|nr:MAG: Co2+/Mg2+ efflux protein ApaG [Alphaproteobacteria bacterium]